MARNVGETNIMTSSDFVERLTHEKEELFEKLKSLTDFIKSEAFGLLSENERELLQIQWHTMNAYYGILIRRLSLYI